MEILNNCLKFPILFSIDLGKMLEKLELYNANLLQVTGISYSSIATLTFTA